MPNMMKAICITKKRTVQLIDQAIPVPEADEVLIKVETSMLCTWEQRVFTRLMPFPLPFIGGHEYAGTIVALGSQVDPKEFPIGARCAGTSLKACGYCPACRRGDPQNCIHKNDKNEVDGTFGLAQYLAISAKGVYVFPDDVPFERIMFTEPLACVISANDKFSVNLGEYVAVLGAGIMGILCAKVAAYRGARVIISEPDADRRAFVEKLGIVDAVLDPTSCDLVESVRNITGEIGVRTVVNTVAIPVAIQQGLSILAPGGTFLMYGKVFPMEPVPIDINYVHDQSMKIAGTMGGDVFSFQRARNMIISGQIDPIALGLLNRIYPKEECQAGYEEAVLPHTFRIAFKLSDD